MASALCSRKMKLDENVPEEFAWIAKYPLYPLKRPMPTTVIGNDLVLMRGSFGLPAAKPGHRYRIRVDGSIHDSSGEGFALYMNGKELAKIDQGVTGWRKQGLRGSHVWQEQLEEFKGGIATPERIPCSGASTTVASHPAAGRLKDRPRNRHNNSLSFCRRNDNLRSVGFRKVH